MGSWISSPKPPINRVAAVAVDDPSDTQINKDVLSKHRPTKSSASSPLGSQQSNNISSSKTPRNDMGNFILTSNKNINDSTHNSRRMSNAQAAVQEIRKRQSGSKPNSGQNSAKTSAKNSSKNSPRTPPSPKFRQESGLFNDNSHGDARSNSILAMKLNMLDNGYVDPPTNVKGMNSGNFILSPSAATNPFDTTAHSARGSFPAGTSLISQSPVNSSSRGDYNAAILSRRDSSSHSRRDSLSQSRRGSQTPNTIQSLKLNSTIEALLQSPIPLSSRRDSHLNSGGGGMNCASASPMNSARRDNNNLGKQLSRRDSKTNGSISPMNSARDRSSFDRNGNPRFPKSSLIAIESGVDLSTMVNNGLI